MAGRCGICHRKIPLFGKHTHSTNAAESRGQQYRQTGVKIYCGGCGKHVRPGSCRHRPATV